jgi:branched-chain amino acid aminotransferase
MAKINEKIYFKGQIVDSAQANLHVASSAVLYGLSVYTVFPVNKIGDEYFVFRIKDHFTRLRNSAKLMGMELPEECQTMENFLEVVRNLVQANSPKESVFARATIHVDELVPGTKSRGLSVCLSIFLYEMKPIVPQTGAKLKSSPWRRNPDFCIPSRAKVNGAYVNSVLAKQDAIDSGYDDAVFLDMNGHVCELSAANIFLVRDNVLITPGNSADILEGINRKTVLEIAELENLKVEEREVDLTEMYIADEVFTVGTSAFVAGILNIDGRVIGNGQIGEVTKKLKDRMLKIQSNSDELSGNYLTKII